MKTLAVLSVVAAVALAPSAGAVGAKTVTVSITHSGFVPKAATIAVGDTVSWVNNDTVDHQVVSQAGAFSSPVLKPAQSFSHTFASAGKFPYGDAFVKSFKGTVTVTGAPAPGVTISAASQVVVYGNGTTLSGTVSNQRSGEKVTVFAQQC